MTEKIAVSEMKEMLPYIMIFNGAAAVIFIVIGIFFGFDWRVFTGLAVGNGLMTANFLLIGYTAKKIAVCRDFRRGKLIGNISYGLRYIGIFVICAALLTFDLISPLPAMIPLFYPKIYYTFIYYIKHRKDE